MNGFSALHGVLEALSHRVGDRRGRDAERRATRPLHLRNMRLEPLEDRTLLSVAATFQPSAPAIFQPSATAILQPSVAAILQPSADAILQQDTTATCYHVLTSLATSSSHPTASGITSHGSVTPATTVYYTPSQIQTAYGLNSISGDGTGQTIAIVDAYNATSITSDLAYFDSYYGLPTANLTIMNQSGGSSLSGIPYDADWAGEITLDVEWSHVIAPGAKIVLVEAKSDSTSNLYKAVSTASQHGSVVSMSWGTTGTESNMTSYDHYFQVSGVTFVASTGDSGSPGGYPAYSPYVVAVGGTALTIDGSTSAYVSEAGWSDSGGGTSLYESEPSYQISVQSNQTPVQGTTYDRTIPDVSFIASDATELYLYFNSAWYGVYGTSCGAPCWAGIFAIVDQLRGNAGLPVLNASSPTQALTLLYSLYASNPSSFHDINTSPQISNGSYSTTPGYDEVTGIGSPAANLLITYMVQSVPTGTPTLLSSYDTGESNSDDITYYNNSNSSNLLKFAVTGTVSGATVAIYADGTAIGSATASSATTNVTTSGGYTLVDGTHAITAKQTESGKIQSIASSALTITIDTTPPTVASVTPSVPTVADANVGTSTFSLTIVFSEAMDTTLLPAISFPVGNPSGTLTLNSTTSGWTNSTTYAARFDVTDSNTAISNISVQVSGAKDVAGNTQTQGTFANPFSIDTLNPTVTINLASGQASTTSTSPINYAVVFSESVVDFTSTAVTLGGTAGASTVVVTGSGTTYNVVVSGMTGAGTVTASIAAGVAHDAVGNANVASTSTNNTVTYAPSLVTVVGTTINDGNAQRSMVDSLTVAFSGTVNVEAGAFDVEKTDAGGGPVAVTVATQVAGGKTVATLTFGGSLTQYGSLVDGTYQLTVYGGKVYDPVTGLYLDGGNIGQPGSNYVFGSLAADHFFRKFGDYNGDGLVNSADLAQFSLAYLNPAGYQWYFDFNDDGHIDALDFYQFRLRYST